MLDKINALKAEISELKASNAEAVEALRLKYLSKKGAVNQLMADFRNVPAEQKREIGQAINELKNFATERINMLRDAAEAANACASAAALDLTRTPAASAMGTRHPLSLVREEITSIFRRLGFSIADGPEIEDDWHVFSALNFAEDHPARDMQDTFFIGTSPEVVLRTHTSSVQTRVMEHTQPPIRIICPGRVYRNEAISARAHCFFHQVEALYVDRNVTFGRDGHQLQPVRRQGLLVLQAHRLGGNPRLRHGGPQCAPLVRHRPRCVFRLRPRHGCGTHRQP